MIRLASLLFRRQPNSSLPLAASFDRPFCFLHIPKTAGTTARNFLLTHFPAEQTLILQGTPKEALSVLHERQPHLAYFGHLPYVLLQGFPKLPRLFTVLRDPVERALSHYYFIRQRLRENRYNGPVDKTLLQVCELEIGDFLQQERDRSQVILGELQTRMLADCGASWQLSDYDPRLPPAPLTRADLKLAKERLRQCVVVGLSHRLHESLELLCAGFGWSLPTELCCENQTASRPKQHELDATTLRILDEITRADRELYEEGVQLFEKALVNRRK